MARYEVLTAVLLKIQAFLDFRQCRLVNTCQSFESSQCIHLQGPAVQKQEDCLTLKEKEAQRSFKISLRIYPRTERNIPEDLHFQFRQ